MNNEEESSPPGLTRGSIPQISMDGRIACGQDAGTSTPSSSRISGLVSRSGWVAYMNAHRPLSQFHSSLTAGSTPAIRRITRPRRMSLRSRQPEAQCSHTLGTDTRSNGLALNR